MAVLAARNLRRGIAMGLSGGQGAASDLGLTPLTSAQLTSERPPAEAALVHEGAGIHAVVAELSSGTFLIADLLEFAGVSVQ